MLLQRILRFTRNTKIIQRSLSHKASQFSQKRGNHHMLALNLIGASSFIGINIGKKKDENEAAVTARKVLLAKADALFDQGQYKQTYDLMSSYRDSGDVEFIWRLCRALYHMAKTANEAEGKKMIYEAYDLIVNALEMKEDHWAVHKWMSILLDSKCNYEGMKVRIRELYNIKKHMLRAIELNPKDATTMYMLGTWCYQVADLAWYQRKIAAVIFGEPPTSNFEEALKYFEAAEQTDPSFYSHNLLMLGKTYLKFNMKEEGLKYLKMAAEYPAKNDDDNNAKQEAQKLLKNI